MATTNNPKDKKPPVQDEYITFEGKRVLVSSLTEEQAKDIVRSVAREHRLLAESVAVLLSVLGPNGMFADSDDLPSHIMPTPDKLQ